MRTHTMVLAAVLATALPAAAAGDLFVSATGSPTSDCSAVNPCTMGRANALAVAGSRIRVAAGTYSTGPQPTVDGNATDRIVYMGNASNPGAAVVPGITLDRSYVSLKWLSFSSAVTIGSGFGVSTSNDSLFDCRITTSGSLLIVQGDADDHVIAKCSGTATGNTGNAFRLGGTDPGNVLVNLPQSEQTFVDNLLMSDCNFTFDAPAAVGFRLWPIKNSTFQRCRFTVNVPSSSGGSAARLHVAKFCRFVDCRWDITNNCTSGCDEPGNFTIRDSTYGNTFERDTLIALGTAVSQFRLSSIGHAATGGSTSDNTFDYCYFKNKNEYAVTLQDRSIDYKLRFCQLISESSPALWAGAAPGPNFELRHCSLASPGGVQLLDLGVGFQGSGNIVTANIFRAGGVPNACNFDSDITKCLHITAATVAATIDSNLYYNPAAIAQNQAVFRPGPSCVGIGPSSTWCTSMGKDCASLWASPQFADTTFATINLRPATGSPAFGTPWPDGYVGAIPPPPDAVTNAMVALGQWNAAIWWTAADRPPGHEATMEIRVSTSNITEATWPSAWVAASLPAGEPGEAMCTEFGGLNSCTRSYFAMKTSNAGGVSAISNVPTGITKCSGSATMYCAGPQDGVAAGGNDVIPLALSMATSHPIRGEAVLQFTVPVALEGTRCELTIYDVSGRRVHTAYSGPAVAGRTAVRWAPEASRGGRPRNGVLFARLRVGSEARAITMVLTD